MYYRNRSRLSRVMSADEHLLLEARDGLRFGFRTRLSETEKGE